PGSGRAPWTGSALSVLDVCGNHHRRASGWLSDQCHRYGFYIADAHRYILRCSSGATAREHERVYSAIWNYPGLADTPFVLTFGTDSGLTVTKGWDNVTGLGTPNGKAFADNFNPARPTNPQDHIDKNGSFANKYRRRSPFLFGSRAALERYSLTALLSISPLSSLKK
ncbi:MAG: hypothetical protein JWP08_3469, partial [Bryobacterales bacterium]|nr:hypothetical protein [Bryobacterales bacterium]